MRSRSLPPTWNTCDITEQSEYIALKFAPRRILQSRYAIRVNSWSVSSAYVPGWIDDYPSVVPDDRLSVSVVFPTDHVVAYINRAYIPDFDGRRAQIRHLRAASQE